MAPTTASTRPQRARRLATTTTPTSTFTTATALTSGLLASSCCVLQLALNAASIGCAGFSALTPYRPFFRALTAASLAALAARQGLTDRRTLATAAAALALAASSDVLAAVNRRGGGGETTPTTPLPPMLLLPPLVAAPLRRALAPLNLPPVLRAYLDAVTLPPPPPPSTDAPKRVALRVKGIRCEACAARVRGALQRVPGVLNATVDVDRGEAVAYVVGSDEEQDELVAAVEGLKAGYEAEVLVLEEEDAGGGGD